MEKTWRHLYLFQHECYLHCRKPRVQLQSGQVLLVDPPFAGKSTGLTVLFEALLMLIKAHGGDAEQIERLSMDMSPVFISAAERYLPKAQITSTCFIS